MDGPMTEPQATHEFQNYPGHWPDAPEPGIPEPGALDWVVITMVPVPSSTVRWNRFGPMSEAQALAAIESVCKGEAPVIALVDEHCEVVQLSPREVLVHRATILSNTMTHVVIGRSRGL